MHCTNHCIAEKSSKYPNAQDLMKLSETIISFVRVGYEIGDSRLVGNLPFHIQRGLMEQLLSYVINIRMMHDPSQ